MIMKLQDVLRTITFRQHVQLTKPVFWCSLTVAHSMTNLPSAKKKRIARAPVLVVFNANMW